MKPEGEKLRPVKMFTVIVPSLGRKSLIQVLSSIEPDFQWIKEVIIIDDSESGFNATLLELIHSVPSLTLKIVRTSGKIGAGNARNIGIDLTGTTWIAFADDDDPWIPFRITNSFPSIIQHDLNASLFLNESNFGQEQIWDGTSDPLIYLYSDRGFFRHKRFLPFGTLIYNRDIYPDVRFDSNLEEREDLWFFHNLYRQNIQFRQLPVVGCSVSRDIYRSISRPSFDSDIEWFHRLSRLESSLGGNFIFYIVLRNSLVTLNFSKVLKILKFMIFRSGNS
jgi:glycosyltransferase involved in cell wall biosynthesis